MRPRYQTYFLKNVLQMQDELATYYVQESIYMETDIPGIELKTFFDHREAADWIKDCVRYDPSGMRDLRSFLNECSVQKHLIYQMEDHEVMDETARLILDYDFQVVVRPLFEPPERQSELIDMIFEAKNHNAAPIDKTEEPHQYYHIQRVGKYSYDRNIALNILKIFPNAVNDLWNAGVDLLNIPVHDVQYIADQGWKKYLKARANTETNWLKNAAHTINDTIQYGPRQVMDAITSMDLETIKEFFGSALYAENWESAVQVGVAILLTKKPGTTITEGVETSAAREIKTKPKRLKNLVEGAEERNIKVEPDEIKPKKKVGPKKTTKIKTRKDFKNPEEAYKHVRDLDGDIAIIKKRNLKISKDEIDITKKNVREWFPEDEYPGIDYSEIDKKLDQYAGKSFDEKELKVVKNYLFDNPKFEPPKSATGEMNGPFYDNAESWMRLAEGNGNHADDILIKHEMLEIRLKYDMGLEEMGNKLGKKWYVTHSDCHGVAEEIYNYPEAIKGIK